MTTKKLLMFAAAGLLTPVAMQGAAEAGRTTITKIVPAPVQDTAPVSNGRLRRTNEEQVGNEMGTFVCLGALKTKCLYFSMTTELPPTVVGGPVRRANDRVQLSLTKVTLAQDATGNVIANADASQSVYVTNNDGNEYRNCNHPEAFQIDTDLGCVIYNYQANNTNDTKRYLRCFNSDGLEVTANNQQQLFFAKNNDDASMHQSGRSLTVRKTDANTYYLTAWEGANGNGRDDGWLNQVKLTMTNGAITATREFDISIAQREERSHGYCSMSAADRNTAICTWTEGNTQPQRDGTWIAAIDVTPGKFSGANQQGALLWKEQLEGRKDIDGIRTYSMRATHERIQLVNATSGQLEDTDMVLFYANDLRGSNNNNEKGGRTLRTNMGIIKADKAGMSYVMPLADTGSLLKGLGGTHLHTQFAVFGTTDALKPGVVIVNGSHTGGHFAGQARSMVWEQATNTFADAGMINTGPFDRHLYPNYLGNNPGNQGRNYAHSTIMQNPFLGQNGNTDAYLMVFASTGKDMTELDRPELKATAYLTIIPLASTPAGTTPGEDPPVPGEDPPVPGEDPEGPGAGNSLGGCSTGGTTGGLATFLLIGLAAFIRRRR